MALCCCPFFFKDNLLFSKHLQPLLSRKGGPWKLPEISEGRAGRTPAGSGVCGVSSGVLWLELRLQSEPRAAGGDGSGKRPKSLQMHFSGDTPGEVPQSPVCQ